MCHVPGRCDEADLLNSFVEQHGHHFRVVRKLGKGGSGTTYLANDDRRGVMCCIKLYDLVRPIYVRRDWLITSTLKSHLLADTMGVELFTDKAGSQRTASISRYIEGPNFANFIQRFNAFDESTRDELRPKLLREFTEDACGAVDLCHRNAYGHGDLSERNIIATRPHSEYHKDRMTAYVIIDFDNHSRVAPESINEESLRASDIRSLKRLIGFVTHGSVRHDMIWAAMEPAYNAGHVLNAVRAYLTVFPTLTIVDADRLPNTFWYDMLRNNVLDSVTGQLYAARLRSDIEAFATEVGQYESFADARDRIADKIKNDPNFIKVSGTGTFTKGSVRTAIQRLLEPST
jgi:serine/threonine protein kinase